MEAFKKVCDQADQSELVSSEECHYWVFEQGYKLAMQEIASIAESTKLDESVDHVTESLMHGFNLLERLKVGASISK